METAFPKLYGVSRKSVLQGLHKVSRVPSDVVEGVIEIDMVKRLCNKLFRGLSGGLLGLSNVFLGLGRLSVRF